jgi:hypothetical protein
MKNKLEAEMNVITKRIVMHRNGDPIHFDITVDLQRIVEQIGYKAERSKRHKSQLGNGAIKVVHIP